MTKLRRKIKEMARKRSHKNTVHKRKLDRVAKNQEARKLAAQNAAANNFDSDDVEEASGQEMSEQKAANILGGLVTSTIGKSGASGKKKQLTRKQLKRKSKLVERGEAISSALDKKWVLKKLRVKQRAQVRNEDVHQ